ncbi:MAG: hypothetical protein KDD50_13465 [Bdellovibrionales bacterium]|nr:hypothetical protein [Bdellovibrionales bacterium]
MKKLTMLSLLNIFLSIGCTTVYKNQNPLNKEFPKVHGTALSKEKVTLPEKFKGEPVIILVGYVQKAQFDIDRWILGLSDSQVKVKIVEVPAVVGQIPSLISSKINNGMRDGIPNEFWKDVITLYNSDAKKIAEFTGNEKPLNARVFALNTKGEIIFFHDRGYSVPHLKLLLKNLSREGKV